jgi:hypothetical protein
MDTRTIHVTAFLVPDVDRHAADLPGSWFITHGIGGPAAGTYTEVSFGDNALIDPDGQPWPEEVLTEAVREVAGLLYGTAYAFTYRPGRHTFLDNGARRRERVAITAVEVWE